MRTFGWRWIWFRICYFLKYKSGWLKWTSPCGSWAEIELPPSDSNSGVRFFFCEDDFSGWQELLQQWDVATSGLSPTKIAEQLQSGSFCLFSWDLRDLGFPPEWCRDPYAKRRSQAKLHWARELSLWQGDIKLVWEVNRFAWVYALVRAYVRDGDTSHARAFEKLLIDWMDDNPPNCGPNWGCGQEAAIRMMAVIWGGVGFFSVLPQGTWDAVRRLALATGRRIEANLGYALFQQNNHGMLEACGLWTIGLVFPEFRESEGWARKGRDLLEQLASDLIYVDGGCSQSSFNYQRLMIDGLVWSARLGEIHGVKLGESVYVAIERAAELLWKCQDTRTGCVPNFGANDGALLLPLANTSYGDYRSSLQAAKVLTDGMRRYSTGPWDEALLWLFGEDELSLPQDDEAPPPLKATYSGYFTLRLSEGLLFFRGGRYRHRPAQADQLHVDVWWRGENVVHDNGTYSYHQGLAANDVGLGGTRFHNTVVVDRRDQMDRVGQFIWLPWAQAEVLEASENSVCVRHGGYDRLRDPVDHIRKVTRVGEFGFLISDLVFGRRAAHDFELRWHCKDEASLKTPTAISLGSRGNTCYMQVWGNGSALPLELLGSGGGVADGCQSRYYMRKEQGKYISILASGTSATFLTWIGGAIANLDASGGPEGEILRVNGKVFRDLAVSYML